jgi:putative FmdB family regulatory protein
MFFPTIGKPGQVVKRKPNKPFRPQKGLLPCHISGIKQLHIPYERTIVMPIYEFRCLKCNDVFEILKMNTQDEVEAKCPHCASEDFERVLSTTTEYHQPCHGP